MMSPQIENPPAIVRTVETDQPVKAKRKRRRSKSKRISEGVVAGVQFNSPVTRMVAIFLNGLTVQEKSYALNLLLQMSRMEAKPIGQPQAKRTQSAANQNVDVVDTDTGAVVFPSVSPREAEGYTEFRNEMNGRNRFVVAD